MLPVVEVNRLEENFRFGTFGVMVIQKQVFCVTLEPPDRLNQRQVSSIPAQQYICKRDQSPRFGETFEITDVPGRDRVLFHAGNTIEHTLGCIILAQHFGKLKGSRAVLNSGKTFETFMKLFANYDEFHLTVREVY